MPEFKEGDIIRYGSGSTALARLCEPHAGGWHGQQCLGGVTFVSRRPFEPFRLADEQDMWVWRRSAWWRHEAPVPTSLPRIFLCAGRWMVEDRSKMAGPQYKEQLRVMLGSAMELARRLNEEKRHVPLPQM